MINTDKWYWHRYCEEYERTVFSKIQDPQDILEFGVLNGDSIKWLHSRFPGTNIVGVDILEQKSDWPKHNNISYYKAYQSDLASLKNLFSNFKGKFDIIIDDGSHNSSDQINCLMTGLDKVTSGGFYIVEDIHTSFDIGPGLCNLLLFFEHQLALGRTLERKGYLWDQRELLDLLTQRVSKVYGYKRGVFPLHCWSCKSSDFEYLFMRCICGEPLMKQNDSMAFILEIK
jgi:hypothetical protein